MLHCGVLCGQGRELLLDAEERVGVYRQLVGHMKAHFKDDARGKRGAFYFLPWHFSFFHRYRHLPDAVYQQRSQQHPLIATRMDVVDPLVRGRRGKGGLANLPGGRGKGSTCQSGNWPAVCSYVVC